MGYVRDRRLSVVIGLHRLKGRRRDGTPDKSATPSQEAQDENRPPSRQIIWDEEIEKLQIKPEELDKVRPAKPPISSAPAATSSVTVRKMKPASELNKPKMKSIMVAKPASPDAPLKPVDYSGYAGPRYDCKGRVIHHSILGSYEAYHKEATARGDLLDIPTPRIDDGFSEDKPTLKYEKKRKPVDRTAKKADENNALRNWQLRMLERKHQQGYISKLLQKEPEDLVMNQADSYRKTQEDRYLIDRTIPFVDYGKGYRVGSEFWKQQERFGDELSGVHMTLIQAERGYPPPVEHVGISNVVRQEKGITWDPTYTPEVHYPWKRSQYLQERRKQLQPIMDELSPHQPNFAGLQVIGSSRPQQRTEEPWSDIDDLDMDAYPHEMDEQPEQSMDPFHEYPDVKPAPIFGPSLQFAGQPARWTGDSDSMADQVGIEARVMFEAYTGNRITSYLEVINDGTTSVFYDWKKLPKENPFDLVQPQVQRFYFNNSSGVVLPGETLRFPFVFKSECAGVFTEQWLLETRPVLCGGAALVLTLRGVALQEDKFEKKREELECDLEAKQSQQVVAQLMQEILSGIRTPKRARSPVDAYITEEEIFHRNNPGLFYRHDAVQEMKQINEQLYPEEERDTAVWDLCVLDLRDAIMELDDEDERKETLLVKMNVIASRLTFALPEPTHQKLLNLCHKFLSEAVDSIVGQSMMMRQTMGLPMREMGDLLEDSDSRKGARPADKGGKPDAGKDKKPAAAKDAKAGKASKEPSKPEAKGKAPTPSASKKWPGRAPPGVGGVPEPRTSTPTSTPHSPIPVEQEQSLERKYQERFYTQSFIILGDTMQQMDHVFQDVVKSDAMLTNVRLS